MFNNILVPLDGSELSRRALGYIRGLAEPIHGRVILVRAAEAHVFPGVDPAPEEVAVVRAAEDVISALCDGLTDSGLQAEWHVYYGPAATAIVDEVDIRGADAIVMCTHGRGGLTKLVLGSVAEQVVMNATVPVLLVPARCHRPWPPLAGGRIVVPLDGSDLAEEALQPAIELGQWLKAGLMLVGIVPPAYVAYGPDVYIEEKVDQDLQAMNEYLSEVAGRVRLQGVPCSTVADVASPQAAIAELSSQDGIVAVVMATHGRSGLARAVGGSITASVVQRVCVPVLVVRPTTVATEAELAEPASLLAGRG